MSAAGSSVQPIKPCIGITPDIEWRDEPRPARAHDVLDAQLVQALQSVGALPFMLPHDEDTIDQLLTHIDGLVLSGGRHAACSCADTPTSVLST